MTLLKLQMKLTEPVKVPHMMVHYPPQASLRCVYIPYRWTLKGNVWLSYACYGMWGCTLCPLLYFHLCVFFPHIVNSDSRVLLTGHWGWSQRKEIAFPQDIGLDLFKDAAMDWIVFFRGVLPDNPKLFCLSPLPRTVWFAPHAAWSCCRPPLPALFVFWTAIFCWWWILFFRESSEGKFVHFVSTKACLREWALICSYSRGQEASGWEEEPLLIQSNTHPGEWKRWWTVWIKLWNYQRLKIFQ